jgi:Dictyostelium (slime mold) repeat
MVFGLGRLRAHRTMAAAAFTLGALVTGCGDGSGDTATSEGSSSGRGGAGGGTPGVGGSSQGGAGGTAVSSSSSSGGGAACKTAEDCDDKNPCTDDICAAGACGHKDTKTDDSDLCTLDMCDPKTGVVHIKVSLDDADACTADACDPITGVSHTQVPVDDNDKCTTDSCDPATGVKHAQIALDDNDVCTTDACDPAVGLTHLPVNIDDKDACTVDACDPVTGPAHTAMPLDDNDKCTTDTCDPVTGVQHTLLTCNDNDVCTTDSCSPQIGCQNIAVTYFKETFANNNAGWTLDPTWQIGSAMLSAGQGTNGPDPAQDHTPTADNGVAGVFIGNNIPITPAGPNYLTSPAIDLTGLSAATLEFYRWLNSDYAPYVVNYVDIFDGSTWINLWMSVTAPGVADSSWQKIQYAVPASALGKAGVKVRFGYKVIQGSLSSSSWNVDDVRILPGNNCP